MRPNSEITVIIKKLLLKPIFISLLHPLNIISHCANECDLKVITVEKDYTIKFTIT